MQTGGRKKHLATYQSSSAPHANPIQCRTRKGKREENELGTRDCFWYPKWIKPDMLSINVIEWDGMVICLHWLPAYMSIQVFNIACFTDILLIFWVVSAYTMRLISSCCLCGSSSRSVSLVKCISRPIGNSNWVTFIRTIDTFSPFPIDSIVFSSRLFKDPLWCDINQRQMNELKPWCSRSDASVWHIGAAASLNTFGSHRGNTLTT